MLSGSKGRVQASAICALPAASGLSAYAVGTTPTASKPASAPEVISGLQYESPHVTVLSHVGGTLGASGRPRGIWLGGVLKANWDSLHAAAQFHVPDPSRPDSLHITAARLSLVAEKDDGWADRKPYCLALTYRHDAGLALSWYHVSPMPSSAWQRFVVATEASIRPSGKMFVAGGYDIVALIACCRSSEPWLQRVGFRLGLLYQHTAHFLIKVFRTCTIDHSRILMLHQARLDTQGNADILAAASFVTATVNPRR